MVINVLRILARAVKSDVSDERHVKKKEKTTHRRYLMNIKYNRLICTCPVAST